MSKKQKKNKVKLFPKTYEIEYKCLLLRQRVFLLWNVSWLSVLKM